MKARFGAGGVCGSDLSYYGKGRVGAGVTRVKKGDRVAINPNQPCRVCRTCMAGKGHLCLKMNFYGSAAVDPHIQGVFRAVIVATAAQCFVVPQSCDFRTAAMAEPLAVNLLGAFRFDSEYGAAVHELAPCAIDVSSLLTHSYKMSAANDAFLTAADRSQSMKVHLTF